MRTISNKDLIREDVPSPSADWGTIERFALTFDGYKEWGSFEKCAEVANNRSHSDLTELRTCLFFEQRRWRHFGQEPDKQTMKYIRYVVKRIREGLPRNRS